MKILAICGNGTRNKSGDITDWLKKYFVLQKHEENESIQNLKIENYLQGVTVPR